MSAGGRRLQSLVVETNGKALVEAVRLIPGRVHLCLEEGTQSAWLYELLKPHVSEIVVSGQGHSNAIADPMPAEQAAVATALDRLMQALSRGALDEIESFHLYGPKFSRFDDTGLGRQDGDRARAAERQMLAAVESFEGRVDGLKVDVFGVAAVATFVLEYELRVGGTPVSGKARSTIVFAKDGGQWKIVHEHLSPFGKQG
jgi:ketosteroid isomerase-like protein